MPGHINANFPHGDENAPWSGIGTAWFYSVNGGGKELRSYFVDGEKKSRGELGNFEEFKDYLKKNRRSVSDDNTYTGGDVGNRFRGDFAVPTLFNGNFDTVAPGTVDSGKPLAGWSYTDPSSSPTTDNLVDWREIKSFDDQRNKIGFEGTQLNYTLKLERDQSITHKPSVIPDWGVLRLDVHAPGVNKKDLRGELLVSINPLDGSASHTEKILLQNASNSVTNGIPSSYQEDKYKIDYGKKGFESFFIPVPDNLRGKTATIDLKLQSTGKKKPIVYLDNVLFQSNSLRFGNPTDARNSTPEAYKNNYLIEKPQYTISFNKTRNTPNWVSSVFDGSWLSVKSIEESTGTKGIKRPKGFAEDPDLDGTGWYKVKQDDYKFATQVEKYYSVDDYREFVKKRKAFFLPERGHLSSSKERSRSAKDLYATFLTTNIFPQDQKLNRGMWSQLEAHLRTRTEEFQHQIHVISGVKGTGGDEKNWNIFKEFEAATNSKETTPEEGKEVEKIQVPDRFWKVIMGFNKGSTSEYPDYAYAVHIPNNTRETHDIDYGRVPATGQAKSWSNFKISIEQLELTLNNDLKKSGETFSYDFLSNITDPDIKKNLKKYGIQQKPVD